MVAMIVRSNVTLLGKCLKSKNKNLFYAAIDNLIEASNNFGPALNKHLPVILPLIRKRPDLTKNSAQILHLIEALRGNGGTEAERIIKLIPLK